MEGGARWGRGSRRSRGARGEWESDGEGGEQG